MKYELITPTPDIIQQFHSFWYPPVKPGWEVSLFQGYPTVNVESFFLGKDGNPIPFGAKDEEIKEAMKNKDVSAFLHKINSTYSTRLDTDGIAKEMTWADLDTLARNGIEGLNGFMQRCKESTKRNAYSFASKVFSFLNEEKYPIVDSITSTLLERYLKQLGIAAKKTSWGNYGNYIRDYRKFCEKNGLTEFTFKQIDIFLWTYGVALQEYWKEEGVLFYTPVSYKP